MTRLDNISNLAEMPRTAVAHILAADTVRRIREFTTCPVPHIEKRTRQLEVTLPAPLIARWTMMGQARGLMGLSGFLSWALNAIVSVHTDHELAMYAATRPDLKRIVRWLRSS